MSKHPKFEIHYNRELGKKYYDKREYLSDMKKAGLEPYDPSRVKKREDKPYERSEWAREMHKDIKDRNGRPPGDRFVKELENRGYTKERFNQARRMANEG